MKRRAAVSIAELLADGVPVHPTEAVALVRRLCATAEDHPPRVSHPTEIVLLSDGELLTGTGRERRLPAAAVLATLLRALLDRAPLGHRAPPALDDLIARGLGLLDTEGFPSAEAFADALQPFDGPDSKLHLRALFARWRAVCDISDDQPEGTQTLRLVLLDATTSTRSVILRKPDRRRHERVVFAADAPEAVLMAEVSAPTGEIRRAIARAQQALARAQENRGVRELALASALLVTVVPAGWWFAGSLVTRPESAPVAADAAEAHAAIREIGPGEQMDVPFPAEPERISLGSEVRLRDVIAAGTVSTAGGPVATPAKLPAPSPAVAPDMSRANQPSAKAPPRRSRRPMSSAFWFPDGKRIGYSRGSVLEIVDVKSRRTRAFSTPRRSPIGPVAVSPDSRRVVFSAGREGAWLVDLSKDEHKQMRPLIADPSARSFVWSPDGNRLAYYSRRQGNWQVIQAVEPNFSATARRRD